MDAYIHREAAVESLNALKPFLRDKGQARLLRRIMNHIGKLPAADVEPVVHGRWKFDGSDFADIWKCTACGDDWYFEYDPRDDETRVNYCPNCGARMDGE